MYRFGFFLFWTTGALLVIARVGFDVNTYRHGATIPYEMVLPGEYRYLLHLPPGYNDFGGPRPLIVYLHGAGETDKGLDVLKNCDLWYFAKCHIPEEEFPFIVVSPQTKKHGWEPKQVVRFVEKIVNDPARRFRIDPERIYLSGVSMGGFGTFRTACEFPDDFAAIVPVCGGGEPEKAEHLLGMPVWAFHGDADDVVPYECSSKMVDAIKELGGDQASLTTLHGAGHGIAGDVYKRRDLYRWLLTQKKTKKQ